jgi:disulfide bond formation protein DsbB
MIAVMTGKMMNIHGLLLAVAAACAGLLGFALVAQYGFGLHPCELCMKQRYVYALVVVIAGGAGVLVKSRRVLYFVALCTIVLLAGETALAGYHTGVELGIFTGPTDCSSSGSDGQTLEEMRAAIMSATLVPCNQAMVKFLGLSMAGWNAIAALALTLATAGMLRRIRA